MKKFISLFLAIIMLISLAVPAFADTDPETGELYEKFTFDFRTAGYDETAETNNFFLETSHYSYDEVFASCNEYVKISAKDGSDFIIKRIEARVSRWGANYYCVDANPGTKRENSLADNTGIVHIDNINSSEFEFSGDDYVVCFNWIKVYYACAGEHNWNNNDICETCGTHKCEVTGEHVWNENDRKCNYCGKFKCEVTGEHNAVTICSYCGKELTSSVNGAGFTVSEGNVSIIVGMACAAVFGLGGYLLGKKKK